MAIETITREEYIERYGTTPEQVAISSSTPRVSLGSLYDPQEQEDPSFLERADRFGNLAIDLLGGRGISDLFASTLAKGYLVPKDQRKYVNQYIEDPSFKEVLGSAIQTSALMLPGAGKGLGLLGKTAVGAGTGYIFDVGAGLQRKDETVGQAFKPGIGTAIGTAFPLGGALIGPAKSITGRIMKGLGSGLSGTSEKAIEAVVKDPRSAQIATKVIEQEGGSKIIRQNAENIVKGISQIRKEARKSYGEGLEKLSETDIDPTIFRQQTQGILDKYGSTVKGEERILRNVEFEDPKNIKKASDLIERLQTVDLDGKSLRKLADDIAESKYKTATSDERLSYNAFVQDFSDSLKKAINQSSGDALTEINQKFSQDMQLAEATEQVFGNVKYQNLDETLRASKKLESLFSQKGFSDDVIDDFFRRVGIDQDAFRATEATRQMMMKVIPKNLQGLHPGEFIRIISSSFITPEFVKDMSIRTGLAEQQLVPILTSVRNLLIDSALLENQE